MTAAAVYVDELVKDYLIFRGFIGSMKAFECDLKVDKEHSYRVDKIVEQLSSSISNYDLSLLRETWHHLDKRVFSRCELGSANSIATKLEAALLKMYVVNCVSTNKHEKLMEFYEKMSSELQGQGEWKDWFAIPFMKSPDENPTYSMYFSRQWMETMLVSLHNFISVSLHTMSVPALLAYEDEQAQIASLKEENEMLKQQIVALKQSQNITSRLSEGYGSNSSFPQSRTNLMDDFYVIAQEPQAAEIQIKSIKSIIKHIGSGLPISPILTRRNQSLSSAVKHSSDVATDVVDSATTVQGTGHDGTNLHGGAATQTATTFVSRQITNTDKRSSPAHSAVGIKQGASPNSKQRFTSETKSLTSSPKIARASKEFDSIKKKPETKEIKSDNTLLVASSDVKVPTNRAHDKITDTKKSKTRTASDDTVQSPYLLLSQEEFAEHHSVVTHCKFNVSGSVIASSDLDGVIKIWSPNPTPKTMSTIVSRSSIMSLEWASKGHQMLLYGNKSGIIRLYDIQDKKTVTDLFCDAKNSLKDYSIDQGEAFKICSSEGRSSPTEYSGSLLELQAMSTWIFLCCFCFSQQIDSNDKSRLLYCDLKNNEDSVKLVSNFDLQRILNMNKAPAATFNCCIFNHNGQLLIGGTSDGRLTLFDVRCNGCIASWNCHENVAVKTIQFSSDETSCYSLGANHEVEKEDFMGLTYEDLNYLEIESASDQQKLMSVIRSLEEISKGQSTPQNDF
ncbi:WD repeat-containing protein 91 [Nymphon striatum]|nr:WD repeat-containing protein 91 [Nymphon striatum]